MSLVWTGVAFVGVVDADAEVSVGVPVACAGGTTQRNTYCILNLQTLKASPDSGGP